MIYLRQYTLKPVGGEAQLLTWDPPLALSPNGSVG